MNIYFLVEGQTTEAEVYPAWLSYLLPELTRVDYFDEIEQNNYYLFSSYGIPYIERDILNAVEDINAIGKYTYFVICLDADMATVSQREAKIRGLFKESDIKLANTMLKIIVQNRCIETWFLGNSKVYTRNPQLNANFIAYSKFYDVCQNDPELMQKPATYKRSIAQFHVAYLKAMFKERGNMRYAKDNSKEVQNKSYLRALQNRIIDYPEHLKSFAKFINFCTEVKSNIFV